MGTLVCSLNLQQGTSVRRKESVGFGQSKVLLGRNDGKRRVRTRGKLFLLGSDHNVGL